MTLKTYIWGIRFFTLIFLVSFIGVLVYVDPSSSDQAGKIIFYTILFFFLTGMFSLFFLFIRRKTIGEEQTLANRGLSFRQGVLISLLFVGLLILQSFRMLVWWDGLLLVAGIFLIELYFLSRN